MENQHRMIKNYRELTKVEIDLMNEIKEKGAEFAGLIAKVESHVQERVAKAMESGDQDEVLRLTNPDGATPFRWLAMAKSDLQVGVMKLTRAVAQPEGF